MKVIQTVFAALLLAAPVTAQTPNSGAVVVAVTDQSGAAVSGATVSIVNKQTGATREASSGADGTTTISGLAVGGPYDVTVGGDHSRSQLGAPDVHRCDDRGRWPPAGPR